MFDRFVCTISHNACCILKFDDSMARQHWIPNSNRKYGKRSCFDFLIIFPLVRLLYTQFNHNPLAVWFVFFFISYPIVRQIVAAISVNEIFNRFLYIRFDSFVYHLHTSILIILNDDLQRLSKHTHTHTRMHSSSRSQCFISHPSISAE